MATGIEEYLGAGITLDHHFSSFRIIELTDTYIKLDSRRPPKYENGIEMIIHFDLKDKDDVKLRDRIKKVYDWHKTYCENCRSGKEKPTLGYELEINAYLAELIDMPFPKGEQREPNYMLEKPIEDWFWEQHG